MKITMSELKKMPMMSDDEQHLIENGVMEEFDEEFDASTIPEEMNVSDAFSALKSIPDEM